MAHTFFNDEDFQNHLVALLCRDTEALKLCGHLLSSKDFQPLPGQGQAESYSRWLVAERALSHFQKYREPIGVLLRSELLSYSKHLKLGDEKLQKLLKYAQLVKTTKLNGASAVVDKVLAFQKEKLKAAAVEELIDLQASGQLTDQKWLEISTRAVSAITGTLFQSKDYFAQLEDRIDRRAKGPQFRNPLLLIDPLDRIVRSIGRQHLGLVLAPYKRGKSLFLIWIAMAYVLQRMNVMFVTLEDPCNDVEDRFDAAITSLPLHRLAELPIRLRKRFAQFKRLVKTRLHIYDGTEGGVTTARLEQMFLQKRDSGFLADGIIIDYDDEIQPSESTINKERRFQFADIYRELRRLASKHNIIVWTAAQTQRATEDLHTISADRLAEDISKVRKATMALSLGKSDWGDDALYLWVAAHKFDHQHVGCNIMSNKKRMLIYDRDRTREKMAEEESPA